MSSSNKTCHYLEWCPALEYFSKLGRTDIESHYCRGGNSHKCTRRILLDEEYPVSDDLLPWADRPLDADPIPNDE